MSDQAQEVLDEPATPGEFDVDEVFSAMNAIAEDTPTKNPDNPDDGPEERKSAPKKKAKKDATPQSDEDDEGGELEEIDLGGGNKQRGTKGLVESLKKKDSTIERLRAEIKKAQDKPAPDTPPHGDDGKRQPDNTDDEADYEAKAKSLIQAVIDEDSKTVAKLLGKSESKRFQTLESTVAALKSQIEAMMDTPEIRENQLAGKVSQYYGISDSDARAVIKLAGQIAEENGNDEGPTLHDYTTALRRLESDPQADDDEDDEPARPPKKAKPRNPGGVTRPGAKPAKSQPQARPVAFNSANDI